MKLSINWLNSYFNNKPNWDEVFYKLTMAGIELEGIEDVQSDQVAEFKITPNRGDALSVNGLLREITVLTDIESNKPGSNIEFNPTITDLQTIEVANKDACPNYLTLIIKNVNNQVKLPDQIIDRLTKSGNRSVSPIVDLANYVMLELGQPLHAFDLDTVGNKLKVRYAKVGEELDLLVDVNAKLNEKTLIISDENDKPAAIAGVMGGKHSGVINSTQNIVLESALFMPEVISGMAKYYGISSDAAYRFERGVDPKLQELAIKYVATLIVKYCGGQIGQITSEKSILSNRQIEVSYEIINRLIGMQITKETVNNILTKLGFIIDKQDDNGISVTAPSHRFDITIKEDVIEEIARVYGYDKIEAQIPITRYTMDTITPNSQEVLKTRLMNLGYSEIVGYAFIEEQLEKLFGNPNFEAVKLHNPIANLNVMRTSLIADLVKTSQSNINRGHKRMRIFELSRVFHGETEDLQPLKIAGLIYGNFSHPNWCQNTRAVDFYDIRDDVEILLGGYGKIKFKVCEDNSIFHGGRCAKIELYDKEIGIVGQLHPRYKSQFDFTDLPYVFELDVASIINSGKEIVVREISKFQKVERDLAFIIELTTNVGEILDKILSINIPYLVAANVFDVYHGEKLADAKLSGKSVKSVAINFMFQANKTLSEDEINASVVKIQNCVEGNFLAQLRT